MFCYFALEQQESEEIRLEVLYFFLLLFCLLSLPFLFFFNPPFLPEPALLLGPCSLMKSKGCQSMPPTLLGIWNGVALTAQREHIHRGWNFHWMSKKFGKLEACCMRYHRLTVWNTCFKVCSCSGVWAVVVSITMCLLPQIFKVISYMSGRSESTLTVNCVFVSVCVCVCARQFGMILWCPSSQKGPRISRQAFLMGS